MILQSLKDIAEFIRTGKTPPTSETKYFNGDVHWFTPGDLDKGKLLFKSTRTLTELAFSDKKAAQFPPDTLLVACIGDIGKLGITTQECSSNQQITGIKPKANVDVSYLYYWFTHNRALIQNTANNAVVPILNNKTLEQTKIPLPPHAEQQKIAAILDAADSLRQKDQQLVERYTALSQSLFLEMFGDLTTEHKFPVFQAIELIDVRDGTHDSPNYIDNGIPLVTSKNIKNGILDLSDVNLISEEDYIQIQKRSKVGLGDIIMPMIGTIGNPHLVVVEPYYAIKNVALYKYPDASKVNNIYLFFILNSYYFDRYVSTKNKGGTQKFLSLGDLRTMPFPLAPIELQNQFAEQIQLIEAQKQQAQRSLEKSEALFNSLLQRAFTGELTAKMAA